MPCGGRRSSRPREATLTARDCILEENERHGNRMVDEGGDVRGMRAQRI
jgi:hypothetical protein